MELSKQEENEVKPIIPIVSEETLLGVIELYPEETSGIEEKIDSFFDRQPYLANAVQKSLAKMFDPQTNPKELVNLFVMFIQFYNSVENQVFEESIKL